MGSKEMNGSRPFNSDWRLATGFPSKIWGFLALFLGHNSSFLLPPTRREKAEKGPHHAVRSLFCISFCRSPFAKLGNWVEPSKILPEFCDDRSPHGIWSSQVLRNNSQLDIRVCRSKLAWWGYVETENGVRFGVWRSGKGGHWSLSLCAGRVMIVTLIPCSLSLVVPLARSLALPSPSVPSGRPLCCRSSDNQREQAYLQEQAQAGTNNTNRETWAWEGCDTPY